MKVTNAAYPALSIPHLGVHFVDGVADVPDEVAASLAPYAIHGVVVTDSAIALSGTTQDEVSTEDAGTVVGGDGVKHVGVIPAELAIVEPRGNASRKEWAEYATRLEVEFPEGAKQGEIRALVAAAKS
ncbi:MAG: hypothetical protein J0H73_13950 [Salana multivorans]|uniref:hypothetical protein n=1 Tax=Salana multivorans TaxID=120377 RepID=UPI00095DB137|nr:hypothetical protein [Salana multivorans]MBN8883404.1 hypothetical protein [Salana multivorans]OJX94081.1 MAG: hypothetical protein BGO96_09755 [Micrococcales bacterium 73-15]